MMLDPLIGLGRLIATTLWGLTKNYLGVWSPSNIVYYDYITHTSNPYGSADKSCSQQDQSHTKFTLLFNENTIFKICLLIVQDVQH